MKEWYDKNYFDNMGKLANYRPALMNVVRAIKKIRPFPKTVLDVGCGHGFLVIKLREKGFKAYGIDFSDFAGSRIPQWFTKASAQQIPFSNGSFDVVVSTDFFEHLPEDEIDSVYAEMRRVGKHIIARIGYRPDNQRPHLFPIDTHLTVKPEKWWLNRLPGIILI